MITVFLYRIVRVALRRINWCRSARYQQAKAANSSPMLLATPSQERTLRISMESDWALELGATQIRGGVGSALRAAKDFVRNAQGSTVISLAALNFLDAIGNSITEQPREDVDGPRGIRLNPAAQQPQAGRVRSLARLFGRAATLLVNGIQLISFTDDILLNFINGFLICYQNTELRRWIESCPKEIVLASSKLYRLV